MLKLRCEWLEDRTTPSTLLSGFAESTVVSGLDSPTSLVVTPDGRMLITQQAGVLRVVQNGQLLATPALTLSVDATGERGLLGVEVDPAFGSNHFIYLYYTRGIGGEHHVSRFTLNGNTVVVGSELLLFTIPDSPESSNHNGGALHFGPDGKLYIAKGDDALPDNAQSLNNLHGKLLRINSDGTIPTDNPFSNSTTGVNRAIWAYGLRNPFTFAFQPGSGRLHINDVGQDSFEEINVGGAGRNFGWATTEGTFNAGTYPTFTEPLFAYPHGNGNTAGYAITGGTFYPASGGSFPADYAGDYLFADLANNWIRRIDTASNQVALFASNLPDGTVDLDVQADGSLLVLNYNNGLVTRINFPAGQQAPTISQYPAAVQVSLTQSATFSVSATGPAPLSYQWQRGTTDIPNAISATYTLNNARLADNNATFRCIVTNPFGSTPSNAATLTVLNNHPPVPTITTPTAGTLFRGGQTFTFNGNATDTEDGTLPSANLSWRVNYITNGIVRPFVPETPGVSSGMFIIPTVTPYTRTDVLYRITLTATDGAGASTVTTADLLPRVADLTFDTVPTGLTLTLDGQPFTTPMTISSVAGLDRELAAPSTKTLLGVQYQFLNWSDSGAQSRTISVPDAGLTLTANYMALPLNPSPRVVGYPQFAAGGASTATLYNPDQSVRFGIVPFEDTFTGGVRVAAADFNADGIADLVAASGPGRVGQVRIFDGKDQSVLFDLVPFGSGFVRGINVSAGDITGDGKAEVVISADRGGGARLRIFSPGASGFTQLTDFIGLIDGNNQPDTFFRGGARSAVGDVNGDGFADLVFAAGEGGGPRVALFDGKTLGLTGGPKLRGDFFAFEPTLRNGTYLAAGDFNGDGLADLVAGAGPGGGPRVTIFSGADLINNQEVKLHDFFAGSLTNRGGARVAVKNLDADGLADLVIGAGGDGGSRVTGSTGVAFLTVNPPVPAFDFQAFPGTDLGVYVG